MSHCAIPEIMMNKCLGTIGIALTLGILLGCKAQVDEPKENPIPVEVSKITLGSIKQSLDYHGDIRAETEVRVYSKIPDRIETYFVEEGDAVRQGEPIARILSQTIAHQVQQAKAGLMSLKTRQSNLKSDLERTKNLLKVDAVSKQQYESIVAQYESLTAQVEQAEAVLATAESQLKDAVITAPMSGIIGRRFLESGDMAMPSLPVATVVQMDVVKITFEATETDLEKLKVGQSSEITVRSCPDRPFIGKVSKISPVLDPLTRMAAVEVLIQNPDHILKPGMFAKISVTTGVLENVIVIPRYAVLENTTLKQVEGREAVRKNYFVYVVNKDLRAEQRSLDVHYINHMNIAVKTGLQTDELLVVSGQNNLRDGALVTIVEPFGKKS